MRLPYLQLEADFVTSTADVVAARAGISKQLALGMGVQLFALAVTETGGKDAPPDGYFIDPDAADVLEHLLGWTGERGRLITAFERAGIVERLEIGLRVRGLDRYRRAWEKNNRRTTGKKPAPMLPVSGADVAGKSPEPAKQTQTQTQNKQQQAAAAKPPPANLTPQEREHLAFQAGAWEERFAAPASLPPEAEFLGWFRGAMAECKRLGRTEDDVRAAYRAFLADEFWASKSRRRCPWSAWAKQWADFLPKRAASPPGGMEFREVQPGEDLYAEGAAA